MEQEVVCPRCGVIARDANQLQCGSCGAPLIGPPRRSETTVGDYVVPESLVSAPRVSVAPADQWRTPARPAPLVALPSGVTFERGASGVTITRRWRAASTYALVAFSLFWNGFMLVWMIIAVSTGEWMMAAAGSLHAVVGVGLAYGAAAGLVNRTVVTADRSGFAVRHTPVRFPGSAFVPRDQIKQVFVDRSNVRYSSRVGNHHESGYYFAVKVIRTDGKTVPVRGLTMLKDAATARFYEQAIEEALGIVTQPVAGEYRAD